MNHRSSLGNVKFDLVSGQLSCVGPGLAEGGLPEEQTCFTWVEHANISRCE